MFQVFYNDAWYGTSANNTNKVNDMYDTSWDYGDLPFKGETANPIQVDTWVQVQSVNESKAYLVSYRTYIYSV